MKGFTFYMLKIIWVFSLSLKQVRQEKIALSRMLPSGCDLQVWISKSLDI